jgi:hypothetical protein
MTKKITKPIKKIVKPVTGFLGGKPQKKLSQSVLLPTDIHRVTTADIKPDDPRLNRSEGEILAERKKRVKKRINPSRETSLLNEGNLPQTIG